MVEGWVIEGCVVDGVVVEGVLVDGCEVVCSVVDQSPGLVGGTGAADPNQNTVLSC